MKDEEMSGENIIVDNGAMAVCRICRDFSCASDTPEPGVSIAKMHFAPNTASV